MSCSSSSRSMSQVVPFVALVLVLLAPAGCMTPEKRIQRFRDAWGNPIIAVFSGRVWDSNFDAPQDRDADSTIRTGTETQCGIASNRQICFVSFGPDGKPGNLDPLNYDPDAAQDNLYSYTPIRP